MATLQDCKCQGILKGRCNGCDNTFAVRCTQCRYKRNFGNAPISADVAASKHMVKTKHKLKIIPKYGEELTVAPTESRISTNGDVPF